MALEYNHSEESAILVRITHCGRLLLKAVLECLEQLLLVGEKKVVEELDVGAGYRIVTSLISIRIYCKCAMLRDVELHRLVGVVLIRVEVSGHNLVEYTVVFGLRVSDTYWFTLFAVVISIC